MKKHLKKIITVGCIALSTFGAQAQDIHFSQFYENAILRNPGLTGIFSGDYKAGVNVRNQWSSLAVPFVTVLASAETRIATNKETGDYLSFGITATYDKAGSIDFTSMQVYPALNYNKALEDKHQSYLSVGFAAGYIQRSVDMSKMTVSNQWVNNAYSTGNPTGEKLQYTKLQHYDLAAGISFNSSIGEFNHVNYYLGAAAFHATRPKESFDENEAFIRRNIRWTGNLGISSYLKNNFGIIFHLNYQNQYPYKEWIGGGFISWRNYDASKAAIFVLYAGCFYRWEDAVIPTLKIEYNQYSFTASYDVNNSGLKSASEGIGGYEFSLFVKGRYKKGYDAASQIRCPRFEILSPSIGGGGQ